MVSTARERADLISVVQRNGDVSATKCDVSGSKIEALDEGFRFRCVKCNKIARLSK